MRMMYTSPLGRFSWFAFACCGALLGSCAGKDLVQPESGRPVDGVWYLVHYGPPADRHSPVDGAEVRVEVALSEGWLSGTTGCNQFKATLETEGSALRIGPLAMTKKMCIEPDGIMRQENTLAGAFATVESYRMEDERLIFSYADGHELVFVGSRPGAAAPAELTSLRAYEGQYPRDIHLMENPALAHRLQGLLGEHYEVFIRNMEVQSPLVADGEDLLFSTGNRAHEGGAELAALIVSPARDQIQVWLATDGKARTYSDKEPLLPDPQDVAALKSNFDGAP